MIGMQNRSARCPCGDAHLALALSVAVVVVFDDGSLLRRLLKLRLRARRMPLSVRAEPG